MLHCTIFVIHFIHYRHNCIVYEISKEHKHHSTYPSMCHCSEPEHIATFFPGSTSTPLSHTTLHVTNALVWIEGRQCADVMIHFYIYFLSQIYFSVFQKGKRVRLTFNSLLSYKGANMRVLKEGTNCRIWSRHYLTNRTVAISITGTAIGMLHSPDLPAALWPCSRPSH